MRRTRMLGAVVAVFMVTMLLPFIPAALADDAPTLAPAPIVALRGEPIAIPVVAVSTEGTTITRLDFTLDVAHGGRFDYRDIYLSPLAPAGWTIEATPSGFFPASLTLPRGENHREESPVDSGYCALSSGALGGLGRP